MIAHSSREEQAFTLIELLVVMIIISILMAVAVPTFLSQKNTALKTTATANIKNVINAVESCASQIPTGVYKETAAGGTDCSDKATLEGYEKSLSNLNLQQTPPVASAAGVDQTQVKVLGATQQGYIVQKMILDSGQFVFFAEIHNEDGSLYKWCTVGAAVPEAQTTAPTSANAAKTKTCKNGKW